jgi:hypothetical protein
MLTGRLPAHPQPPRNVRPADPQRDGVVDQQRQLHIQLIPLHPVPGDLLQHLRRESRLIRSAGPAGAAGARCR